MVVSVHLVVQKLATAKVDNPDPGLLTAGFDKNVVQLDVPVEHAFRVDLDDCIHQLFCDDLGADRKKYIDDAAWWARAHVQKTRKHYLL